VGRLFVALALGLPLAVAGCGGDGGKREAQLYRQQVSRSLVRLDTAARGAEQAIDAFENGNLSFRVTDRRVAEAGRRVGAVRKALLAVRPPARYAAAHRGLLRSATLLRTALWTYDQYLRDFVLAVSAFRQSQAGELEAARATQAYHQYALRFRGFQIVARAASEAAPDAIVLPAALLAYSPPNTVVYVTREGVFAGAPTGS